MTYATKSQHHIEIYFITLSITTRNFNRSTQSDILQPIYRYKTHTLPKSNGNSNVNYPRCRRSRANDEENKTVESPRGTNKFDLEFPTTLIVLTELNLQQAVASVYEEDSRIYEYTSAANPRMLQVSQQLHQSWLIYPYRGNNLWYIY